MMYQTVIQTHRWDDKHDGDLSYDEYFPSCPPTAPRGVVKSVGWITKLPKPVKRARVEMPTAKAEGKDQCSDGSVRDESVEGEVHGDGPQTPQRIQQDKLFFD